MRTNVAFKRAVGAALCLAATVGAGECVTFRGIRPGDAAGRDGLANPERGFRFEVGVGCVGTDRVPWDRVRNWPFERFRKDGVTLTQAYCYLTQYHDTDIPHEKIAALEEDFARAREAGVKFLLRFAYETDMNRQLPGPTAERILSHIRQLTPVVRRNLDVVYVLQTGWVGAWGEFHSSVHGVEKDPKAVAAIVKATLDMLPPGHFTMMRCMRYKTNVLKDLGDPREITAATAWSDAPHARIGFFNDGFLANENDGGTFLGNPAAAPGNAEYDKVARESPWMPVDGELFWTPAGELERSNATNAIVNLRRHHFTSLSLVHGNSELEKKQPWTIDGWKNTPVTPALLAANGVPFDPDYFAGVASRTGYEFIRDHLGYRIAAKRFACGEVRPGKPLALSLELFNYGFGTPFKERKAVFVVIDAQGKAVELETGFSCRVLLPGTGAKVEWQGTLDAALGRGPYRIGLWLPDAAPSLRRRTEYAIRLASALPVEDIDGRRVNMLTGPDAAAPIPQETLAAVYEAVKTPHKVGMVLLPDAGKQIDCPNVFRHGDRWWMLYVQFDNRGYETHLAESDDLVHWKKRGCVLARGPAGAWDAAQADGGPALLDPRWEGPNTLGTFDGKYWMTYLGGALEGYETDPLSISVACAATPTNVWQRARPAPALTTTDADVRPFEAKTLYKSFVVEDPECTLGARFVMYYNAKAKDVWRETIGIALSDDMANWRRLGREPVVENGRKDQHCISGDPVVRRIGDLWVMFYFGHQWKPGVGGAFDTFAVSRDLVHWTKWEGAPLVAPSEPWDATHAHKPWVLRHGGVTYHFYCAVGDKGRGIALATSVPPAVRAVNPIVAEGAFLADPAGRVGPDGALWVFGSRDCDPGRYCSAFNDVLRTDDALRWTRHDGVFSAEGIDGSNRTLYAPDAIFYRGKWRLFFCTPGRYVEGVAEAARPEGPFANPIAYPFARQIDPSVFVDDDGKVYYTWGQFSLKMARLKDDLSGIDGEVREGMLDERRHHFHEGSQLFKRNGIYYLAYADISRDHGTGQRRPTSIGYATATSVFGPYTYRGVIVDNYGCDPETWNNHGSVVEHKGRWYVFYHRTTNASRSMRKACVEEIFFDKDGLIREVEMTCGGPAGPLDPFATTAARLACGLTGHVRVVTSGGRERLGGIRPGDTATWRHFDFARPATALELDVVPVAGGRVAVMSGARTLGEAAVAAGNGTDRVRVTIPLAEAVAEKKAEIKLAFAGAAGSDFGFVEAFRFQ